MEALIFIKKYHKPFIGEINNDIYDEDKHNYDYYYITYCPIEYLEKYKEKDNYKRTFTFMEQSIIQKLSLPLYFDKYRNIDIRYYNITIDYNFKNIQDIKCKELIINHKNNSIEEITIKKLIINNKNNIKKINFKSLTSNISLVFNYPISQNLLLKWVNHNIYIINNTNKQITFEWSYYDMFNEFKVNDFKITQDFKDEKYHNNKFDFYKSDRYYTLIIKPNTNINLIKTK